MQTRVIVDAMGGDNAPFEILRGVGAAMARTDASFTLVGSAHEIERLSKLLRLDMTRVEVIHAPAVVEMCQKKRGLVLVTGPTGSGKSTTLASLINIINHTMNHHIITMEDPIEYLHYHHKSIVNQREMGSDSANYASALRAALREDPDVLLVGEMRDLETISTAITAAETGHLVFSSRSRIPT